MKSMILGPLLVLLSMGTLHAQTFHGGVYGGLSASQVDGDSFWGFNKPGLQAGVFVFTRFTDAIGMQLEVRYMGKGAQKYLTGNQPDRYLLALHYIDIPVIVYFGVKNYFRLEAGVVPGYLFHANGKDSGGSLPDEFLVAFRKADLATLIGLQIPFLERYSVSLRYSYSLISIRAGGHSGGSYTWVGRIFGKYTGDYNNYLSFGVFYTIR